MSIRNQNATSAIGLAEHFADKGLSVAAKPNTVVGEAVRLTNLDMSNNGICDYPDCPDLPTLSYDLHFRTSGTLEVPSAHDVFMDQVGEQVSKAVTAHVSFAKNIVKPLVLEVGKRIEDFVASNAGSSVHEEVSICEVTLPRLLDNPSLLDELKVFEGRPPIAYDSYPDDTDHEDKTEQEILSLLMTGDAHVDEDIQMWAGSLGSNALSGYWNRAFTFRGDGGDGVGSSPLDKLNRGIFLFLMARRLYDDITHVKSKVALGKYKEEMARKREDGGRDIMAALKMFEAYRKTRRVVLSIDERSKKAHVLAENYNAWLNDGGAPEAILGMIVSGKTTQGMHKELLDSQSTLIRAWESFQSFSSTQQALKRFEAFKSGCTLAVRASYEHVTSAERENWASFRNFEQDADTRLQEEVQALSFKEMTAPYAVATKLLCRSRFYYTAAERILMGVESVMQENPNMPPREAATVAVCLYVADYLADQLTLTP